VFSSCSLGKGELSSLDQGGKTTDAHVPEKNNSVFKKHIKEKTQTVCYFRKWIDEMR